MDKCKLSAFVRNSSLFWKKKHKDNLKQYNFMKIGWFSVQKIQQACAMRVCNNCSLGRKLSENSQILRMI